MRRALRIVLLAALGCGGQRVTSGEAEHAASIADRIATQPRAARAILEQEGMDRQQYEALLYGVAADPEATRSYIEARRESLSHPYAPPRLGPSGQGTF